MLREITRVLYSLKRKWSFRCVYQHPSDVPESLDTRTGVVTRSYTPITIRKAIILPEQMQRSYIYDLAYIAANKNFTYGGLFDKGSRYFIIETKDLHKHVPSDNDYIVYAEKVYSIKEIINVGERAYMFRGIQVKNTEGLGVV